MIIEFEVIDWLNNQQSIPAYGEEPENPNPGTIENYYPEGRSEFYVVQKTGSSMVNHIRSAMIVVQSYAGSLSRCAEMNENAIQVMSRMIESDGVTAVRLNSDYPYIKEETKQPRYQAVFDIYYY